jgi:hypothetical protein
MSIICCQLVDIGLITRIQKSIGPTQRFRQKEIGRLSKIHGFGVIVENMFKIAPELKMAFFVCF